MKNPLYALLISPDKEDRAKILSGAITCSIREGYRDYRVGPVMLCCHRYCWSVLADITEVRAIGFEKLTPEEVAAAGYKPPAELLEKMKRFYPNVTNMSAITVIRWTNLRGQLVGTP